MLTGFPFHPEGVLAPKGHLRRRGTLRGCLRACKSGGSYLKPRPCIIAGTWLFCCTRRSSASHEASDLGDRLHRLEYLPPLGANFDGDFGSPEVPRVSNGSPGGTSYS